MHNLTFCIIDSDFHPLSGTLVLKIISMLLFLVLVINKALNKTDHEGTPLLTCLQLILHLSTLSIVVIP